MNPNKTFISNHSRGVSAVGVMITVAVIGITLAVAVPAQMRAREISHARICQENLARIGGAIDAYSLDTKRVSGEPIPLGNLVKPGANGYLETMPQCPAGGAYTIDTGAHVSCSVGENRAAEYAPHETEKALPAR